MRQGTPTRSDGPITSAEMTGNAEMLLIARKRYELCYHLQFDLETPRGKGVCKAVDGRLYNLRYDEF